MSPPPPGASVRRAYDLRLARLDDARLRERVARWAVPRMPGADPAALSRALAGPGLVVRLELADGEAAALLRDLYALGVPPVAVALLPQAPRADDRDAERRLAVFRARGGRFAPTWNWAAFIFGPLWYFRKGLWAKGLVLLVLTLVPFGPLLATLVVWALAFAYCGLVGNWDYYLWRVKRRQWW